MQQVTPRKYTTKKKRIIPRRNRRLKLKASAERDVKLRHLTIRRSRRLQPLNSPNVVFVGRNSGKSRTFFSAPRVLRSQRTTTTVSPLGKSSKVSSITVRKQTTSESAKSSTYTGEMERTRKKQALSSPKVSTTGDDEMQEQSLSDNQPLMAGKTIGKKGGTIEISKTEVMLHIPPGALKRDIDIKLRIIPQKLLKDETFSWNSSAVVEVLPNKLKLEKYVTLTLPHCFVLKEEASAKVQVSHHEQENKPYWEEVAENTCKIDGAICTVLLKGFSWIRVIINKNEVLAKTLVLYTAGKRLGTCLSTCSVEVGYYPDLPGEDKFLKLNSSLIVTKRKRFQYLMDPEHPLRLSVDAVIPSTWKLCAPKQKSEEIAFQTIADSIEYSRPFTFQNRGKKPGLPTVHFKVSQDGGVQPIVLSIQLEELNANGTQPVKDSVHPMKDLCMHLSGKLSQNWKDVGRKLSLGDDDLSQVETDNRNNNREAIYAMFLRWIQAKGTKALPATLKKALVDVGRADLASEVDRRLETDGRLRNGLN